MKKLWERIAFRIDALSIRARGSIFISLAFALIVATVFGFLNPQFSKQKELRTRVDNEQKMLTVLNATVREKAASLARDPDAEEKIRIEAMKKEAEGIRGSIVEMQRDLVPAQMMARVLEDMLKRNDKLQLRSLKSIAPVLVNQSLPGSPSSADGKSAPGKTPATKQDKKAVAAPPPVAAIYRHGVEIQVEGSYLNILDYLAALESLPWRFYWGAAKLNVDDYPSATLTLTIYTLSLDSKWLGI